MFRQITRMGLLILSLLFLNSYTGATPAGASSSSTRPPNIVLILADDLGIGDVGVYGGNTINTPNIDALAGEGVKFTQSYVTHPVCSPSRAGLITGRHQQRHGWEFNPAGRDTKYGMSLNERTLADMLGEQGYKTGMVGKWHLGHQKKHHPLNRGFDEYFGVLAGGSSFIDPNITGVETIGAIGKVPSKRSGPYVIYDGFQEVEVKEYLTDRFTQESINFIDRHKDKPFFLYLSHTTPHTPLQATEKYLSRYRHIEDKKTRIYSAMVSSLDDSVAHIVRKLKSVGQYENTLIVFTSDNGCAGYIGNACSNAPHAGFKRYHQEGGIRVPFILSWPKHLPSGSIYQQPVSVLDLFDTFKAVSGGAGSTGDSVNLMPYLTGKNKNRPHEFLYWRSGPTKAIRDARWKLIRYNKTNLTPADLRSDGRLEPPALGWPSSSEQGQLTLLYDLANDPGETTNLAKQHRHIVKRLETAYEIWESGLTEEPIIPGLRSTLTTVDGQRVQLIF